MLSGPGAHFVAVGSGFLAHGDDGDRWEVSDAPWQLSILRVAAFGSRLVAVGGSGALYSDDQGETWTPASEGKEAGLRGIPVGKGRVVAVGFGNTIIYR